MSPLPTHEFPIPVHDLDAAGKPFSFVVRAAWIRGALEGQDVTAAGTDGELDVRVSKSGTDVVVHGRLRAQLEVPCARCLEPAKVAIDQALSVLLVPAPATKSPDAEEYEFTADEADVMTYEGDTVVLDDVVRDELLLELPMIPLCSQDCPGISPPPTPDAEEPSERPIDPRLAPLLKLRDQPSIVSASAQSQKPQKSEKKE